MADTIYKLRPDRDLQCYFQEPSLPGQPAAAAIAALSQTSPTGFTISGSWRQQADWAVLEWNRDNTFEHPAFRNLPDGDLSGVGLSYEETRSNCIPIDSALYAAEWAYLRVWVEGTADPYLVPLINYATAIEGKPQAASVELELDGTATAGDYVGLAWLTEQYWYQLTASDTIETAAAALADAINSGSTTMCATVLGGAITLAATTAGANWNRVGVYGYVGGPQERSSGPFTESWSPWWGMCSGGVSPTTWKIDLAFNNLTYVGAAEGQTVPVTVVRKMRWTYSAGWQDGKFQRSEFEVQVTNWTVTGNNLTYSVAGPGSRRIEDDAIEVRYLPPSAWTATMGPENYSGGSYHSTTLMNAQLTCTYQASCTHSPYLGVERLNQGAGISITVDGDAPITADLNLPGEDELVRIPLGSYGAGTHTVVVEHTGPDGALFNFDFLEVAIPTTALPSIAPSAGLSLATDWDTYHSLCLAPERTARMISALGFRGRVNHYAGAMWFYELVPSGFAYASAQISFNGVPAFYSDGSVATTTQVTFSRTDADPGEATVLAHNHYVGDTADTIAKAFEMAINHGSTTIWAEAQGTVLTIYSRTLGTDGNKITVSATPASGPFIAQVSGPTFQCGTDGSWLTDLEVVPRLNRAARDWSQSFFTALKANGLDASASLSMELRYGDPSTAAGIAQRCPAGDPVMVNTPALQTNFSPTSIAFWQQAYQDLAATMDAAGMTPYLQFGEVQWWYFQDSRSGMPYYDEYTTSTFQRVYGRAMKTIPNENAAPAEFADEAQFLPTLIGQFTQQITAFVRAQFPACRFEVLYPLDVNATALDEAVNYPAASWTTSALNCLKTENFGYTAARDLNKCLSSIVLPQKQGFPVSQSAHLVGISDPTTPWQREVNLAQANGDESVVLFALDQLCLVGYSLPLPAGARRSGFQG